MSRIVGPIDETKSVVGEYAGIVELDESYVYGPEPSLHCLESLLRVVALDRL